MLLLPSVNLDTGGFTWRVMHTYTQSKVMLLLSGKHAEKKSKKKIGKKIAHAMTAYRSLPPSFRKLNLKLRHE